VCVRAPWLAAASGTLEHAVLNSSSNLPKQRCICTRDIVGAIARPGHRTCMCCWAASRLRTPQVDATTRATLSAAFPPLYWLDLEAAPYPSHHRRRGWPPASWCTEIQFNYLHLAILLPWDLRPCCVCPLILQVAFVIRGCDLILNHHKWGSHSYEQVKWSPRGSPWKSHVYANQPSCSCMPCPIEQAQCHGPL
jgi:hypothetical protein